MSGQSEGAGAICPICRKAAASARFAPFCSQRCADLDLGRWLKGGYAIPGEAAEEAPDGVPAVPEVPEDD
jgi:endogenous inhibitor of DNA gyrase (YacG/DUF329 family)